MKVSSVRLHVLCGKGFGVGVRLRFCTNSKTLEYSFLFKSQQENHSGTVALIASVCAPDKLMSGCRLA